MAHTIVISVLIVYTHIVSHLLRFFYYFSRYEERPTRIITFPYVRTTYSVRKLYGISNKRCNFSINGYLKHDNSVA